MWNYIQPVNIKFGNGIISELNAIFKDMGLKNGLIVCQDIFIENGLVDRIKEASGGLVTTVFSAVESNPTVKNVDECAAVLRANKNEFIVALGGGSVLDCAKAAGSVCLTNDPIAKYHGTGVQIPDAHLPLIAMPTTAGTGSEVTCIAVLTDPDLGKKSPVVSNGFYPALAVIDPELTYSMPPKVTAFTGIDVLCHALEGFWSVNHQPICDALALHACDLVFKHLYTAYQNPNDVVAREKMAEASVIAGLAFTLPKTTSSHACSFPLTNLFHIAHGEACGLTLDYFARINAKGKDGARIDDFAQKLGFKDTMDMADAILDLKKKMGLLCDLKSYKLTDANVADLVRISRHPNLYNNPVEITDEMLLEMYEMMR